MDVTQREINRAGYNAGRSPIAPLLLSLQWLLHHNHLTHQMCNNLQLTQLGLAEENLGIMTANFYNVVVNGQLPPPVLMSELDQIHPDDVEEMDIS